jgi:acyl-ACP thioesterase
MFEGERRVRLGDVGPTDRLRFDAVARYLQDIARDDSADSGLENPMGWVVRRTVIEVARPPVFQERVRLCTWCSGIGSRWAERRTSITGEHGGSVETATVWVHVDPATGRPARLGAGFAEHYAESAAGRVADARLAHDPCPDEQASRRAWPLRHVDYDVLGHVNNAAAVAVVEEVLGERGGPWADVRVEIEYREPVQPGEQLELVVAGQDEAVGVWLVAPGSTHLTARVMPRR